MGVEGDDGGAAPDQDAQDSHIRQETMRVLKIIVVPSFLQRMSERASIPVLPKFVKEDLRSNDAMLGLVVAAIGLGKLFCGIPSGFFVSVYGAKAGAAVACSVMAVASVAAACVGNVTALLATMLLQGAGLALWQVSRQTFVTAAVPPSTRGRFMSTLGGVARISSIFGPLVGGFVARKNMRASFIAQSLIAAAAVLVIICTMPSDSSTSSKSSPSEGNSNRTTNCDRQKRQEKSSGGCCKVVNDQGPALAQIAVFLMCLMLARETRNLLFPVKGMELGLLPPEIGTMTSISFIMESAMFPAAGCLMDYRGRKWSGVPASIVMGLSFLCAPLATGAVSLTATNALGGMGNGLSSGLLMSIGSDMAPPDNRAQFLGVYRTFADLGVLLGPLCAGLLTSALNSTYAFLAVAGFAFVGAVWMAFCLPETKKMADAAGSELTKIKSPSPKHFMTKQSSGAKGKSKKRRRGKVRYASLGDDAMAPAAGEEDGIDLSDGEEEFVLENTGTGVVSSI